MFFFRVNKITIFSNRESKRILGLFGKRRKAEIRIMSFVTTEFTELPNLSDLNKTIDPVAQKKIIEQAVASVVGSRVLTTVENVSSNQKLTFGDTGYVVYQGNHIPDHFDWLLLVMEDDTDVRDNAAVVQAIVKHPEFDTLSSNLLSVLNRVPNPAFIVASEIGKFAVNLLLEKGKKNKDDQVGLLYLSLNRPEHYPFGERKRDDVPDLTQNILVDYSLFGVDSGTSKRKKTGKRSAGKQPPSEENPVQPMPPVPPVQPLPPQV